MENHRNRVHEQKKHYKTSTFLGTHRSQKCRKIKVTNLNLLLDNSNFNSLIVMIILICMRSSTKPQLQFIMVIVYNYFKQ